MGWGGFLDKLLGILPIQKRQERWKNEIDKLEQRQAFISIHKRNDLASEYERNAKRLQKLQGLIKNASNAS